MNGKKIILKKRAEDLPEETEEIMVSEQVNVLKNMGLDPSSLRPQGEIPVLPSDVTALSLIKLGQLHGQFVAWGQWANSVVAMKEAKLKALNYKIGLAKRLMKNEENIEWEILEKKFGISPELDLPEVVEGWEKDISQTKIFLGIAEEMRRSIKEGADLLSREQSRRRDTAP